MERKSRKHILILVLIHVFLITLSNVLVAIPLTLYSFKITYAAFSFPLIVVATDLSVRLLGKSIAQKTITYSYPLAIISSVLMIYVEGNPLSVALRIGLASATAYALGILIDIHVFQFIREKYTQWFIAPALSTIFSNIMDSYIFFFLAFFASVDNYMSTHWFEIAGTQTVIKIIIGLLFFLPTYGILLNLFVKKLKQ